MGNAMGGRRKRTKVMKIDGETFKLNTPTRAFDVIKDHPDHVLLESEAVKHYGLRARPLEPHQELKPKKLYFLVQLPTQPADKAPRRVRSGVHVSAMDRLECLMLSRRSISDLQIVRPGSRSESGGPPLGGETGTMRVKVRLPRAQVEKLMKESKDKAEVAEKIVNLCMRDEVGGGGGCDEQQEPRKAGARSTKAREKRVSFVQMKEGEIPMDGNSTQ